MKTIEYYNDKYIIATDEDTNTLVIMEVFDTEKSSYPGGYKYQFIGRGAIVKDTIECSSADDFYEKNQTIEVVYLDGYHHICLYESLDHKEDTFDKRIKIISKEEYNVVKAQFAAFVKAKNTCIETLLNLKRLWNPN